MQFTQVTYAWYQQTFWLYLLIILSCYIISIVTPKIVLTNGKHFERNNKYHLWIGLVGTILFFFKGFGTTGRDLRGGYYYNFLSATSMSNYRDQTVEIGYRFFSVIIRNLTSKYSIFVFILAVLTLAPVLYLLYKYRTKIDIPTAVLLYVSVYFFSGFSPMRQYLASSIALLAFDALVEKKPIKSLICILLASTFHIIAIILLIPYMFTMFKLFNKQLMIITVICVVTTAYFMRTNIAEILLGTERYDIYGNAGIVNIGMEQFVYFLPLFYVFWKGRRADTNSYFSKISFSYLVTAFLFGLLGYIITILGRSYSVFLPLIIIIPYYIKLLKLHSSNVNKKVINILVLIYCISRFVIYITQYYDLEDLMPYTNIFGWIL